MIFFPFQVGSKVLGVSDATFTTLVGGPGYLQSSRKKGLLNMHGIPRLAVWTRVNQTAAAGATTIVVDDPVDFVAGEKIVVTSSSTNLMEAEELVVVSVSPDKHTITFTPPLRHQHRAQLFEFNGQVINLHCEVGLLSRNVIVQGDDNSAKQLFGSHMIASGGGDMKISNIEIRNCGQAFNLGRYCLHWHMASNRPASYAKYNSIHHSFQRAITMHGTHQLNATGNFGYRTLGHTFFVEDGAEMNNLWLVCILNISLLLCFELIFREILAR